MHAAAVGYNVGIDSFARFGQEGMGLYSELWQFVAVLGFFAVAFVLWMWIVYLPGRSLERWEDQRVRTREEPSSPGKSET